MSRAVAAPDSLPEGAPRIGVFDSGVGGLSVLRELHAQLPGARLLYIADAGHAPYGERTDAHVIERSERITNALAAQGCRLVVVACNTATAAAAHVLRARYPDIPLVGVEPAVKPAVRASASGRIGVMATTGTLRSEKFQRLLQVHGGSAHIISQPCPGLARLIEQGDLHSPELLALIESFCAPLREERVDTVVLGCTHYPFVRSAIQAALGPQVELLDTAPAIARQALRLVPEAATAPSAGGEALSPRVELQTTGDLAHLRRLAAAWLDFPCTVSAAAPELC